MVELLDQLDREWFAANKKNLGDLSLKRLWGLAKAVRDKGSSEVCDFELFGILWETLRTCTQKFDPAVPPRRGIPQRRRVEDRFAGFFRWKLVRNLARSQRRTSGDAGREVDVLLATARYPWPRATRDASTASIRTDRAPGEWIHSYLERLTPDEREIVRLRFWEDATWDEIARRADLSSRFKARRELDRILEKLRDMIGFTNRGSGSAA